MEKLKRKKIRNRITGKVFHMFDFEREHYIGRPNYNMLLGRTEEPQDDEEGSVHS